MAKKYFDIGLWVEYANKNRSVSFVRARFDCQQNIMFIVGEDNGEIPFPLRFKVEDALYGDILRAVLSFAAGSVTPLGGPNSDLNPTPFE